MSDSNFATDRTTRKSLSSGHVYIDRCLMSSFVRSQKVTLSSGEAELIALTQMVCDGESILIHKAWEFLTRARLCVLPDGPGALDDRDPWLPQRRAVENEHLPCARPHLRA